MFVFVLVASSFGQQTEIAGEADSVQNSANEINLDSLVASQISAAQAKQLKEKEQAAITEKVQVAQPVKKAEEAASFLGLDDTLLLKIEILLGAIFIAAIVIVVRRLKLKKKPVKKNLKSAIQSIRVEKPFVKQNEDLKTIRENLQLNTLQLGSGQDSLTRKARELHIAKGELILAAKIKSYELSVCSNER